MESAIPLAFTASWAAGINPYLLVLLLGIAGILTSQLLQGQDAIVLALESRWRGFFVITALVFWATVTWYSSRLIAYNKDEIFLRFPKGLYHAPRLLGYACFAVALHAFLVLPGHSIGRWPAGRSVWRAAAAVACAGPSSIRLCA